MTRALAGGARFFLTASTNVHLSRKQRERQSRFSAGQMVVLAAIVSGPGLMLSTSGPTVRRRFHHPFSCLARKFCFVIGFWHTKGAVRGLGGGPNFVSVYGVAAGWVHFIFPAQKGAISWAPCSEKLKTTGQTPRAVSRGTRASQTCKPIVCGKGARRQNGRLHLRGRAGGGSLAGSPYSRARRRDS